MILIVGLGNPGEEYENTRHNLGFLILDKMAEERGLTFQKNDEAEEAGIGNKIKLIKPQTFMNESGRAVSKIKNYYKIEIDDVWVIYDDVDLEEGKVRISFSGSSAGHKGVQSMIDSLDNNNFWRIRIGIGRAENIPTENWVLKNLTLEEQKEIASIVDKTSAIVLNLLDEGISEQTINVF